MESRTDALPETFCWTRFGTEAGQTIDRIVARKEIERRANDGVFYWGIGNSVAQGLAELIKRSAQPEVLFSSIRSRPRPADVKPLSVVVWRMGEDTTGRRFELPKSILVMSRGDSRVIARPHYALVCSLDEPLAISDLGRLGLGGLRNLVSGNPVGASQVTAVVRRASDPSGREAEYVVAIRARLIAPYFVRLLDPIVVRSEPSREAVPGRADQHAIGVDDARSAADTMPLALGL